MIPRTTPASMFLCTYGGKLSNLHISVPDLTRILSNDLHGSMIAINSNLGYGCQPGYESHLKKPGSKSKPKPKQKTNHRPRKILGIGTSFGSALEPIMLIPNPDGSSSILKLKCFSTTGAIQVAGLSRPDISDGPEVFQALASYLNEYKLGDIDPVSKEPLEIKVYDPHPIMLNTKFTIIRDIPKSLINVRKVYHYLNILEKSNVFIDSDNTQVNLLESWPNAVIPPYLVRETSIPFNGVSTNFCFRNGKRSPYVIIYKEGKVNILGAESLEQSNQIHAFITNLFTLNWEQLICMKPLSAQDILKKKLKEEEQKELIKYKLTDLEIDQILDTYLEDIVDFTKKEIFYIFDKLYSTNKIENIVNTISLYLDDSDQYVEQNSDSKQNVNPRDLVVEKILNMADESFWI